MVYPGPRPETDVELTTTIMTTSFDARWTVIQVYVNCLCRTGIRQLSVHYHVPWRTLNWPWSLWPRPVTDVELTVAIMTRQPSWPRDVTDVELLCRCTSAVCARCVALTELVPKTRATPFGSWTRSVAILMRQRFTWLPVSSCPGPTVRKVRGYHDDCLHNP